LGEGEECGSLEEKKLIGKPENQMEFAIESIVWFCVWKMLKPNRA
jgi:hypothetical protein